MSREEVMVQKTKELRKAFVDGAKSLATRNDDYRTDSEWEKQALLKFKRRILGFCGQKTVKSVDELTNVLTELGVVGYKQDGVDFVRRLDGQDLWYNDNTIYLKFTKMGDSGGGEGYEIKRIVPVAIASDGYP